MGMKIGYIIKTTDGFKFREAAYTRIINDRGDKIYSKMLLYPVDYEDLKNSTEWMKELPGFVLIQEPFLLDNELKQRAIEFIKLHNKEN